MISSVNLSLKYHGNPQISRGLGLRLLSFQLSPKFILFFSAIPLANNFWYNDRWNLNEGFLVNIPVLIGPKFTSSIRLWLLHYFLVTVFTLKDFSALWFFVCSYYRFCIGLCLFTAILELARLQHREIKTAFYPCEQLLKNTSKISGIEINDGFFLSQFSLLMTTVGKQCSSNPATLQLIQRDEAINNVLQLRITG